MLGVTVGYALANDARWNGTETAVQDALDAVAHVHAPTPSSARSSSPASRPAPPSPSRRRTPVTARGAPVAATVCSWPLTTLDARFYAPSWEGGAWRETSPASVAARRPLFAPRGAEGVGGPQASDRARADRPRRVRPRAPRLTRAPARATARVAD